ncbi:PAS domain-containing protein [Patescibacteria group bacterium]|nr:PAS domain-containing protein [Patescibacteria group bacterium]
MTKKENKKIPRLQEKSKKTVLNKKTVLKMEKLALANILEDIQEDREEVESQRKAILNILEDVNFAQTELKQKYKELEAISELTHALGLSLELTSVMHSAGNAINNIIPNSIVVFCLATLDSDYIDNNINIYSVDYLGERDLGYIKEKVNKALTSKCTIDFCKVEREKLKIEFLLGENKKTEISIPKKNVIDHIDVPINILNKSVGLISIFRREKIKSEDGQFNAVSTIIGNVTQTIERLRILVSSEYSRFSNLVDSMSNGVLMFDLNRKLLLVNPRAQKVIGRDDAEFTLDAFLKSIHGIKKTFSEDVGGVDHESEVDINNVIDNVIMNNEPASFQDVEINKRSYELFITPIRDFKREISGGAIVLHDITYLKEINQLKSEFVSVASHQLRTPLTSIRLFSEMLLDEVVGKINKDQKEYVGSMHKSTVGMIQLVNNLLNLSRIEAGRLEVRLKLVDLETFIKEIIEEVEGIADEKGVAIVFNSSTPKLADELTDPNLLRQVIHNLVVNAIRYSEGRKKEVCISLAKENNDILINVRDYGIGIPSLIHERIFSKFFRADNAVKVETDGNGLGLYIAKTIIEGLNGEIRFESEENQGTTFYIKLPSRNK